jgi:hypothetical protein
MHGTPRIPVQVRSLSGSLATVVQQRAETFPPMHFAFAPQHTRARADQHIVQTLVVALAIVLFTKTLVIDEHGCYDPSDFNDGLLLGLRYVNGTDKNWASAFANRRPHRCEQWRLLDPNWTMFSITWTTHFFPNTQRCNEERPEG